MLEFEKLTIDEIICEAREKNNPFAYNYLIKKYEGMVHGIIRKHNFYIQGGEYEDLVQEGSTGLYKAIRDFKSEHGSFEMFCKIVVKRHIITAIKKSTRLKHKPMNEMYSFDKVLPDNENLTMMDIIGFKEEVLNRSDIDSLDPEERFILEETQRIQSEMLEQALSKKEKEVHRLHVENKTYKEIMEELNILNPKEVDNTIQRIKRKFKDVQLLENDYSDEVDEKKQKIQ